MDITQILKDTLSQVETKLLAAIPADSAEALAAGKLYLANFEKRASDTLQTLSEGNDTAFYINCVKNEKTIFVSEGESFAIMGESIAQGLINDIIDILTGAVLQVLPATSVQTNFP
jgi:hypothetical protein